MHQGSVLSPLLFVVVMDVAPSKTRSGIPSELLYADDLVLMAPNDTAYTRWSCHSGLANLVQIVSTPPAPSNGAPITVFFGQAGHAAHWIAGNAPHKSGRCRD